MNAEIIAVGDELSSGQRLDTNSQWISQQLGDLGIAVSRHTTIGDNLAANVSLFREAAGRSDIVVISGGLGPTLDDLTREALGQAFGLPLQLDTDSLKHIEDLFSRRGRPMPERNRVQAMFPRGTIVVPNPHGSAPGIDLTVSSGSGSSRLFALPGVPAEMKQMWAQTVQPRIQAMQGDNRGSMFFHTVKLFGLGESDVEARVPTLIARDRFPTVGITVSQATITLRIAARAKSQAEFDKIIAPTLEEIQSQLGEIIFGSGEDEVQDALVRQLVAKRISLACVEVGGSWINQVMHEAACADFTVVQGNQPARDRSLCHSNGDSGFATPFVGGLVFRNQQVAEDWLKSTADTTSTEKSATLLWLAQQIRVQFGATIGLAVSGYPSTAEIKAKPPATTFEFGIAVSGGGVIQDFVEQRNVGGHPDVLNTRVAKTAMDLLRRRISEI